MILQPGYVLAFISSAAISPVSFDRLAFTYYRGSELEENHYYPFGLNLEMAGIDPTLANNVKYNSKELQHNEFTDALGNKSSLTLEDYGARMQDPQIGRWNGIDDLAEKYFPISPYVYVANNPIICSDPDGRTISVGNVADQKIVKGILNDVFSKYGTFSFENNELTYTENKGNKKEMKGTKLELFNGIQQAMKKESGTLSLKYIKDDNTDRYGGEVTTPDWRYQKDPVRQTEPNRHENGEIDPSENWYSTYLTEDVPLYVSKDGKPTTNVYDAKVENGSLKELNSSTPVKHYNHNSVGDRTIHSIGHFIRPLNSKDVNLFENIYREIMHEQQRDSIDKTYH